MANDRTGKQAHQRAGRTTQHGIGDADRKAPPSSEDSEAAGGVQRDAEPRYKQERTDVPGLKNPGVKDDR